MGNPLRGNPWCSPGLLVRGSGFSNPLKHRARKFGALALVAATQPVRDFFRSLFSPCLSCPVPTFSAASKVPKALFAFSRRLFSPYHGTSHAKCASAGNSKHFTDATTVEICLSLSSEKAVKTQIWCATYTLIAFKKKELQFDASLYTCIQMLSVSILEKYKFHAPCSNLLKPQPTLPRQPAHFVRHLT